MESSIHYARINRSIAIYEAAFKRQRDMPVTSVRHGVEVYRSIRRGENLSTARGARMIPHNASKHTSNRWDGAVSDRIGQGGLNLSSDRTALFNEALFYARPREFETATGVKYQTRGASGDLTTLFTNKLLVKMHLRHSINVVNLHANERQARAFLSAVQGDSSVQAAQRDLKKLDPFVRDVDLVRAMKLPDSYYYDITRALGVAAMSNSSLAGLVVDTVRNDWARASESQGNVILAGGDGQELLTVEPTAEMIVGHDNHGHEMLLERALGINDLALCSSPETVIDLSSAEETTQSSNTTRATSSGE